MLLAFRVSISLFRFLGTILAKYIAHLRHSVTGRASSPLNVECKEFEDDTDEEQGKKN